MASMLNCKYFTYVSPSSPGSPISSEKISPKISIPDSLEIVSIGLVSTFVSTNKTGGGVSSKNDNNDLICSGDPFSSVRSEEHTSELQSRFDLVCRLLLEKKKKIYKSNNEYNIAV